MLKGAKGIQKKAVAVSEKVQHASEVPASSWVLEVAQVLLSAFPARRRRNNPSAPSIGKALQPHMVQKPVLRGEVGARALRVRSVSREEAWASTGVQGAWVSACGCEAD